MGNPFAAGASAAIMLMVKDIEQILNGEKLKISGPMGKASRQKIQATLIKSSRSWYKKGFNRGHKEAFLAYKANNQVPTNLAVDVKREFVPNTKRTVTLKSTLTKAFCQKA